MIIQNADELRSESKLSNKIPKNIPEQSEFMQSLFAD